LMNTVIDPLLHDEVLPSLEPGEVLLWAGRPDPLRTAREKVDHVLFGAGFILLFFLANFSCIPAAGAYLGGAYAAIPLRPAILSAGALLTLYGVLLPLFTYRTAKKTVHAVTDRRVLSLIRGRSTRTVRYEDMLVPILDLRPDGRGDIQYNGKFRADGTEQRPQFPCFLGIEAAESVYQLLLGRMAGSDIGRTSGREVQDYLELLLQGKRNVNGDLPRD